ncbi:hypothetical protein SESBI_20317 [Sesbania bispinosa]|nr:hypothetical protein SESBI_20317 [Sesbania bispinosa]
MAKTSVHLPMGDVRDTSSSRYILLLVGVPVVGESEKFVCGSPECVAALGWGCKETQWINPTCCVFETAMNEISAVERYVEANQLRIVRMLHRHWKPRQDEQLEAVVAEHDDIDVGEVDDEGWVLFTTVAVAGDCLRDTCHSHVLE